MFDNKDIDSVEYMVNSNSDSKRVADYINNNLSLNVDIKLSKILTNILVYQHRFSLEDIEKGLADKIIKEKVDSFKKGYSSVKSTEGYKKSSLKTKKEHNNNQFLKKAFASIMAIAIVVGVTSLKDKKDKNIDEEIDETIESSIAFGDENKSIVSKNTYRVGLDSEGKPIVAYNNAEIAKDIIGVYVKDPEFFDLCLYDVYFDMNHNRLVNMDEVISNLKRYASVDESLSGISDKLNESEVFLDYLLQNGYAKDKDTLVFNDIANYKKSTSSIPLNSLSEDSKDRILDMIDNYDESKMALYEEYQQSKLVEGESYGR